ncbi:hypothetical protein Drorol1_Dr00026174 [Drosera rotundifolia]
MAAADAVAEEQRKRAMEALERRYAVAEVEALRRSGNWKRRREEESGEKDSSGVAAASGRSGGGGLANRSSKSMFTRGSELDDPIYQHINLPLHENLTTIKGLCLMPDQKRDIAKHIMHELFKSGDIAEKFNHASRARKSDNWILLDNHVQGRGTVVSNPRALQHQSKRSKKRMSMTQFKKYGAYQLPEEHRKFDTFVPIHEMWKNYVKQHLKYSSKDHRSVTMSLIGADLHGAVVRVVECKDTTLLGVVGIMIQETAETFGIITQDNKFKVVPKMGSVFILQADCWKVTLLGDKLVSRNILLRPCSVSCTKFISWALFAVTLFWRLPVLNFRPPWRGDPLSLSLSLRSVLLFLPSRPAAEASQFASENCSAGIEFALSQQL